MTNVFSRRFRSELMRGIRSTGTKPEKAVEAFLASNGFRFRPHAKDLPGSPDFAIDEQRIAIFVHGCFWHRHACRKGRSMPAVRVKFWSKKFQANVVRDRSAKRRLRYRGWTVVTIWECQTTDKLDHLFKAHKALASINGRFQVANKVAGAKKA